MWPSERLTGILGTELPIIQAPMAGAQDYHMAAEVSQAGGLGSLPCAMLGPDEIRRQVGLIREATDRPFNLNFFCHVPPRDNPDAQASWKAKLTPYYHELELDPEADVPFANRAPFDETLCELVEELAPPVVSFHFGLPIHYGLPSKEMLRRVKDAGAVVLSSATTVAEARWLEEHGCDVVIAQGAEAGGHRGCFMDVDIESQPATMALVPQIADAVQVPVVASGGIADSRGAAAAFALGADGVQLGTAYLHTPESTISRPYRQAISTVADDCSALTNIFSGRPARGIQNRIMRDIGPITGDAPAFPTAAAAIAPLRKAAEEQGDGGFSPLWAGQAVAIRHQLGSAAFTRQLADETLAALGRLASLPGQ